MAAEQPELKPPWLGGCGARYRLIVLWAHQDDGGKGWCPPRVAVGTAGSQSCGHRQLGGVFPSQAERAGRRAEREHSGVAETCQTHSTPWGMTDEHPPWYGIWRHIPRMPAGTLPELSRQQRSWANHKGQCNPLLNGNCLEKLGLLGISSQAARSCVVQLYISGGRQDCC